MYIIVVIHPKIASTRWTGRTAACIHHSISLWQQVNLVNLLSQVTFEGLHVVEHAHQFLGAVHEYTIQYGKHLLLATKENI
jgi:hypothetical protein